MNYTLAIDQGTHASRACLFDEFGLLAFQHTQEISLQRIDNQHIEQDPNEVIDSVKNVIQAALDNINRNDKITSCGIAIQRSSVLAWQTDGNAISPVLSWQDSRGKTQVEKLKACDNACGKTIQKKSGLPLSAHYGASKLHYLFNKTNKQNHSNDSIRLSPLISYLLFHILEQQPYIVDHTNAQRTQLFDIKKLRWSNRLCELFDVPIKYLPHCVCVSTQRKTPHGYLVGTKIPVTAISGDQNAAIFNNSVPAKENILINIGSGAFALHLQDKYSASEKQLSGIAYSQENKVTYMREATINGAGSALTWLEEKHPNQNIRKNLAHWLSEIKTPPVFINTIGGLASPWWISDIAAYFLTPSATKKTDEENLAKQFVAVIESIAFMIIANIQLIEQEQTVNQLTVSGGLSQLDGLCQRLANLSMKPVNRLTSTEATARGIAWLSADKPDNWVKQTFDNFKPEYDLELSERYQTFTKTVSELTATDSTTMD